MPDVLTPEQRSRCMAAIRGKDTTPELAVRRMVTALGARYRLHERSLPGVPDLVFRSRRKVILVHGCFWHRHECPLGRVTPKTREAFWSSKLEGNKARDARNLKALRSAGWRVLVVWECELRHPSRVASRIQRFLSRP